MIKILFLAANPSGTDRLALDKEIRAIDTKIRGAEHRDHLQLLSHWAVRLDDLSGILLRHNAHVIHFSGHGTDSGAIMLEGGDGQHPTEVPPQALAGLFRVLKDNVRVVLLNACYSQLQAKAIVREIDYAVGMSNEIHDHHAIAFAAEFYQALAYGRSVQDAFDLGVVRLVGEGVLDAAKLVKLHKKRGVGPAEDILVDTPPPEKENEHARQLCETAVARSREMLALFSTLANLVDDNQQNSTEGTRVQEAINAAVNPWRGSLTQLTTSPALCDNADVMDAAKSLYVLVRDLVNNRLVRDLVNNRHGNLTDIARAITGLQLSVDNVIRSVK